MLNSLSNEIKDVVNLGTELCLVIGGGNIFRGVTGVSKGHEKTLELSGVGFRANIKGDKLNLQIGFSHDINFQIPKELKITVEKQTVIKISGVDKELVSKTAADIKNLKPVEPYKAKGIKERGQFVLRKEGKKK